MTNCKTLTINRVENTLCSLPTLRLQMIHNATHSVKACSYIDTVFSKAPPDVNIVLECKIAPYIASYIWSKTVQSYFVVVQLCVSHCRYWLWYTTQRCVSGVVRKVYQRLKQFKVQFLVLQRKTDLSQVLLQCLPANKVCHSPLFIRTIYIKNSLCISPVLSVSVCGVSATAQFGSNTDSVTT